ncbi:hypothetical protein [Paenibacillus sp. YYML68]|uniref:hypothetical protein n=1 Tax=Paenibacillus sp. YYML68 TaxID=2909250 RepID=UPI0024919326|nr:hypothetical protein [Paenibacillus sp. YYML68]
MMESIRKPMGVGAVLDRSFQLYRSHFVTAFLFVLLFYGPFYFLQTFVLYDTGTAPLLPDSGTTVSSSMELFLRGSESSVDGMPDTGTMVFIFLLMPLYMLLVFPASIASQLHLVQSVLEGRPVRFGEVLRKSFTRYGKTLLFSFLYALIMITVQGMIGTVLVIALMLVVTLTAGLGSGLLELANDPLAGGLTFIVVFMIIYLLSILVVMAGSSFFIIRFGYFLPIISVDNGQDPLGRSWRLTRGHFWRIFLILVVLTVIYTVFSLGLYALVIGVFKMSLIGQLILVVLSLLIMPIFTIPYALLYFDLRVRNEGSDLEQVLSGWTAGQQVEQQESAAAQARETDDQARESTAEDRETTVQPRESTEERKTE